MSPVVRYPTSALVAVAWLSQRVPGLTDAMVATSLPRGTAENPYPWAADGFVQATVITGTPDVDVPIRRPLVQVDCWAMTPNSGRPPIAKAANLAELVRVATELDSARYSSPIVSREYYGGAIVLSAYVESEPAEIPDDPSGYAHVTLDLRIEWVRA